MLTEAPKPIRPKRVPTPKWRITHHVMFYRMGSNSSDPPLEEDLEISSPDVESVLNVVPHDVFAFMFFDMKAASVWVEEDLVYVGKTDLTSGRYYIGGNRYTAATIESMANDDDRLVPLLASMKNLGIEEVIQTRLGNWQPFTEEDVALPAIIR